VNNRVTLFFIVTALFWFALYAYVPFFAPYAEEMQADVRLIGLMTGAYGFVQMVIRFPLGIISDRLRKRKVFVMAGLAFAALSGLVVFIFPSPMVILAARSFAGVAASSWVIFTILGAAYNTNGDTVKTIGTLNAYNSLGRVAALLLGGLVAELLGFSYAFLLAGVAGLIGLALSTGVVEKRPEAKQPPKISKLLSVARNKQLLCASILAILSQYISFSTTFGFVPLVATRLGATNFMLGMLGVAATLPGIIIAPMAGRLLKKFGVSKVLFYGFLLTALACTVMPFSQEMWQLFVVQIANNVGLIVVFTSLMGLCIQNIETERRATAMGFFQAVYGLGMFLGPFVMGWLTHALSLMAAFVFTGGIAVLGAIVAVVFVRKGFLGVRV